MRKLLPVFCLTRKPTHDSLYWLSQEGPGRPRKAGRQSKARQMGMNLVSGRKRGSAKRCYFDGTNSMFCCKQTTYKSSMCKNRRIFDTKRIQIEPKKGPEAPSCVASKRGLGVENALLRRHLPGARRASDSTLRPSAGRGSGGFTPPSAAGAAGGRSETQKGF